MKLTIEVDIDKVRTGKQVRNVLKDILSSLDQIPDHGALSAVLVNNTVPFVILGEALDGETSSKAFARVAIMRADFDNTTYHDGPQQEGLISGETREVRVY